MESTHARTLDDLLRPGDTIMVATTGADGPSARPLTVARVDGDIVQVLIDRTAHWAQPLHDSFDVLATLSDNRDNRWVSMTGRGYISTDQKFIDQLWSPFAGAFFEDGKESPGVAVLSIEVSGGEYWDTAGGVLGSLWTMIKAKLGNADHAGERGPIDLDP